MRILILTASTGGGHKRASAALKNYICEHDSAAVVKIVDAFEYLGPLINKTISEGYHYLATKTPKIYGHAYRFSDNESILNSFVSKANSQMSIKLLPLIAEFRPDAIVTCHPFVTKMMGVLKSKKYITTPVIAIITDFAGHRAYIDDYVDQYVVANDDMIAEMVVKYNVDRRKVHPLGIPIFSSFYEEPDKEKILSELGFTPDLPVLLIMAGSFGVTDILQIYENLIDMETPYQIIVITGKNKRLHEAFEKMLNKDISEFEYTDYEEGNSKKYSKLSEMSEQLSDIADQLKDIINEISFVNKYTRTTTATKPTKLFYFVDNVQDYMHVSDLIITKPGGLTVSESLATNLPLAIFRAFPGQEEDNADYLVRHNIAITINKGRAGAQQINSLIKDADRLSAMKENCRRYSKRQSAENIYQLIRDTVDRHNDFMDQKDKDTVLS